MKSFREICEMARPVFGIPVLVRDFDSWGYDVKKYAEEIWPELAEWFLAKRATDIVIELLFASPIERKLYLALKRRYIGNFMNYPDSTALLVRKKLSEISHILVERGQRSVYQAGEIDYEIDLFFYFEGFTVEGPGNIRGKFPFFIAIECDGHDYHEKTKEQAQKDKSKDRALKKKGLPIVRFTGSEITANPDKCAQDIDELMGSHFQKIREILEQGGAKIYPFPERDE